MSDLDLFKNNPSIIRTLREIRKCPNDDIVYQNKEKTTEYLLRNDKIIAVGKHVWSYANMDYSFRTEDNYECLMRDGKTLYITEPNQEILSYNTMSEINTKYLVENNYLLGFSIVKDLSFPFKTSILDVVDNKIKENKNGTKHNNI